jgi:hypothetical protein
MAHTLRAGHGQHGGRLLTVLEGLVALVFLCALVAGAAVGFTLIAVRLVRLFL